MLKMPSLVFIYGTVRRVADAAILLPLLVFTVPASGTPLTPTVIDMLRPLQNNTSEQGTPASAIIASGPEKRHIQVTVNQKPYHLEVVKEAPRGSPPTAGWPLVLITHGAPGRSTSPKFIGPDLLRHWVSYFAARGYYAVAVARRGYATSDGPRVTASGTCSHPNPEGYLLEQAKDLQAITRSLLRHRTIDTDTVLVVGHSVGGMASLALNQRIKGLKGIINISGGLYRFDSLDTFNPEDVYEGCERFRAALINAVGRFAGQQTTPSLWLYSESDDFFPPALVRSMADAWNSKSVPETAAVLHFLPPSNESHKDFIRSNRTHDMAGAINEFLLAQDLPAEPDDLQLRLEGCLSNKLRTRLGEYLQKPSHRALAISSEHDWLFWNGDTASLEAAAIESLADCKAMTGAGCKLLAWDTQMNDTLCASKQ